MHRGRFWSKFLSVAYNDRQGNKPTETMCDLRWDISVFIPGMDFSED